MQKPDDLPNHLVEPADEYAEADKEAEDGNNIDFSHTDSGAHEAEAEIQLNKLNKHIHILKGIKRNVKPI